MADDQTLPAAWRIQAMSGGSRTINHPWIAIAPSCPDERHPTRWCACRVFTSRPDAVAYIEAVTAP